MGECGDRDRDIETIKGESTALGVIRPLMVIMDKWLDLSTGQKHVFFNHEYDEREQNLGLFWSAFELDKYYRFRTDRLITFPSSVVVGLFVVLFVCF